MSPHIFGRARRDGARRGGDDSGEIVLASFAATDGTTLATYTSDSGHAWKEWKVDAEQVVGDRKFSITSGGVIALSAPGQPDHGDVESGVSDCRIRIKVAVVGDLRIVFRAAGANGANKWVFEMFPGGSQYYVYKFEAAAFTTLDTVNGVTINTGDEFEVVLNGDSITATHNDVDEGLAVTNSFQSTATRHGVSLASTTGRIEWFKVLPL